ncbi:unnamed protein product, partial [Prorocentrum cordatum]
DIVNSPMFKEKLAQYEEVLDLSSRAPPDMHQVHVRAMQAAAAETRDAQLQGMAWSKRCTALTFRQVARAVARQHVSMAERLLVRHTWLEELMTVDVMKGVVMLKDHAEFLRRFVLAQRRVARARLLASPAEVHEALANHWGEVFCPPARAACLAAEGDASERCRRERDSKAFIAKYGMKEVDWSSLAPPSAMAIEGALRRARPAAPGVDGLPARAWLSHSAGCEVLLAAQRWMALGRPMRKELNMSIAIFPPKKVLDGDGMEVIRKPNETRPLMLRSTGPKAIASAVNFKLKSMIDRGASKAQRGFITGRDFLEDLVELDAMPRVASMCALEQARGWEEPTLLSFDFAHAFPSLLHDWMWWVLEAWTAPLGLEHLLKESYANVEVVEAGPCHWVLFVILCGILQGDPLSGTMFAIGAQPFVEARMKQLEAKALGLTRWCADDIQALIFCRRGLRSLARIFRLAERLAGLQLQPKKCAAAPRWAPFSAEVEDAMRKCLDEACGWGSFTVASSVELLGCSVGPGASLAAQWAAPLARLRERVLALAASPLDMTAAFFEHGRRCQPVPAYKAQLWPMPTELIDDERCAGSR